jgi:uncharacterized protein (TIGR02996 family)
VETSVGDWVGAQLTRSAKNLEGVEPKPLTPADEKRLTALEKEHGVRAAAPKGKARGDAELLAMVYAAPADDQPRLVFADALTERGDERGEFISLQVARARGQGTAAQLARERELSADRKRSTGWALPLSNGGDFNFSRGFPSKVTVKPATAKKVVGEPAWATVHALHGLLRVAVKTAVELLDHPVAVQLRDVEFLGPNLLDALAVKPRSWARVGVTVVPPAEQLASWSAVESLSFVPEDRTLVAGAFAALPKLRTLDATVDSFAPGAFESLSQLESLSVHLPREGVVPGDLFAPLTKLRTLSLSANGALAAPRLSHLKLESLSLYGWHMTQAEAAAVVKECPSLTRLELSGPFWLKQLDAALELIAGTQVKELRVQREGCSYSVRDGALELTSSYQATPEQFEAGLKRGLVKSVRFGESIHDGDPLQWRRPDAEQLAFAEKLGSML